MVARCLKPSDEAPTLIKTKMLVMRPGRSPETLERDLPGQPKYEVLRDLLTPLLDGAYLERVKVLADFEGGTNYDVLDMFVDEEGLLNGLPRNDAATAHYRRATMMGRTPIPVPDDPESIPYVVGPAVLFDRRVWF